MEIYTIILWSICFIGLYFSIFFIYVLYLSEETYSKTRSIKTYPTVTIITPAWNEEETILKTTNSILASNYPRDKFEYIVVNDASTDKTGEILNSIKDPRFRVIHRKINSGCSGGSTNTALPYAKGEIIGIIDADATISKNSIKNMVHYFEDPKVGAVIAMHKVIKPRNLLEKLQHLEYLAAAFSKRILSSIDCLFMTPGALSLYRKKPVIESGGFDVENLTEDIEMGVRLNHMGYLVKAQINSMAKVKVPDKFKAFHRQRMRWARGYFRTMIKHKEMILNPKYDVLGTFVLPIILFLAPFSIAATALLVYNLLRDAINSLFALGILKTGIFSGASDSFTILGLSPVFIPVIFLAIAGAYFLAKSIKWLRERWKYPLATLLFFTLYQPFIAAYWMFAIIYESIGARRKW